MQQVNLPKTKVPISDNAQNNMSDSNWANPSLDQSNRPNPQKNIRPLSKNTQHIPRNQNPLPSQNDSWGSDSWGSSWDDPWGDNSNKDKQKKKMTPQERTDMIQKVYQDVLGREADTRDINYYKYSTLEEYEILKQVLTGKEHKQIIQDGREYKNMKSRAEQAETRIKSLESQIKDQVVEFRQLTELLQEKNRYINQLRLQNNNPYNLVDNAHQDLHTGNMHYSQSPVESEPSPQRNPSPQRVPQPQIGQQQPINQEPAQVSKPQQQFDSKPQFTSSELVSASPKENTSKGKKILSHFVNWINDLIED